MVALLPWHLTPLPSGDSESWKWPWFLSSCGLQKSSELTMHIWRLWHTQLQAFVTSFALSLSFFPCLAWLFLQIFHLWPLSDLCTLPCCRGSFHVEQDSRRLREQRRLQHDWVTLASCSVSSSDRSATRTQRFQTNTKSVQISTYCMVNVH